MLEVNTLTKRFGSHVAIRDVSFRVRTGEVVALAGHNGCGKSTTMNIIAGYLTASSGSVTIDGEDTVRCAMSVRAKTGYLPETPPLYPDMTVEEQLRFACGLRGIRDARGAMARACAKADVSGVRGRLIRNLSKGYRQRIGLAQALLGEPKLLILDEPTAGLDPQQVAEMRGIIAREAQACAVLMSTHVLPEIAAMCSRMVVLSGGQVVADDTPQGLRRMHSRPGKYEAVLEGEADALRAALSGLEEFDEVTAEPGDTQGVLHVRISTRHADAGLLAAQAAQAAGGRMTAFRPAEPTLEEVFLTLTRDTRYEKRADDAGDL